jgi:hypothetical protein
MKRTYILLCSLSMVLACGGDDEMGGSDPTMGVGTETDASTGSTSDGPTTNSPTTTTTTTSDPTTGPTSDPDTGETEPGEETGDDSTETGDETGEAISFAQEIWPILDGCSCHKNAGHQSGLVFPNSGSAYTNLVGVASGQFGQDPNPMLLVAPASSADSYLWHKVNDTHLAAGGSGGRMPAGGAAPLSPASIDLIADWIDDGAEP